MSLPEWRLPLAAGGRAASQARAFLRERLQTLDVPPGAVDAALLVASELVTNAVLHGAPAIELTAQPSPEVVRLEVADGSPVLPQPRDYGLAAMTGRGLSLIATVSSAWGTEPRASGKVVWAEIAADRQATAPGADGSGLVAANGAGWLEDDDQPDAVPVQYRDVPVRTYLALQEHNDALCREAELVALAAAFPDADDTPPPAALVAVLSELPQALARPPERMRATALAALRNGQLAVTLTAQVRPAALPAAERLVGLMESADRFAADGELLTAPADPAVAALRRWFVEQLRKQLLDRRPAGPD